MKSFRLYWREPTIDVTRTVEEYSVAEKERFLEDFQRQVGRNRVWCLRLLAVVVIVIACSVAAVGWMRVPIEEVVLASGLVLCAVAAVGAITVRILTCPACENEIYHGLGRYCPECGAPSMQLVKWLLMMECAECHRQFPLVGKRTYSVRVCTHCGVHLE